MMGYIDREAKSMRTFIGKTYSADVSSTMEIFDWKPISLEKTVLDTAKSIDFYLNKN
jgi:dihydroflavonol-4-reductase